ncbi:O-antigen ligase family protein [Halosimplex sp. J119]
MILVMRILVISAVVLNIFNIIQGLGIIQFPGSRLVPNRAIAGYEFPVQHRAVAIFTVFASYGIWSVTGLSLALSSLKSGYLLKRKNCLIGSAIIMVGITFVLQSRAVWLGMFASVATYSTVRFWITARKTVFISTLSVVVFSLLSATPHIVKTFTRIQRSTIFNRIHQYMIAIDLTRENPIFGSGLGKVGYQTGTTLHNLYLQLLAYNGTIGFLLFLIVLVGILRGYTGKILEKSISPLGAGIFAALVGCLIIAVGYPGGKDYLPWVVIAIAYSHLSLSTDSIDKPL